MIQKQNILGHTIEMVQVGIAYKFDIVFDSERVDLRVSNKTENIVFYNVCTFCIIIPTIFS